MLAPANLTDGAVRRIEIRLAAMPYLAADRHFAGLDFPQEWGFRVA